MRLLLAMLKHETNTFSPIPTGLARFRDWALVEGAAVAETFAGTNHPLAAYLDLAREAGAQIVTPMAAEAMPSGPVEAEAYEYLCAPILDALRSGNFDGALLDLHGAMVVQGEPDGEGALLAAMRRIAPELPIAVTCDLHANMTERMAVNCTALIGYKTYPHVDMYAVGEQVGKILLRALAGEIAPVMAWESVPLLAQTLRMGTADQPMSGLQAMALKEEQDGALAATVFGGFPLSDIEDAGVSAVVVANGDTGAARAACGRLAAAVWSARADFIYQAQDLAQSVARAKTIGDGPVILLDHADNTGSGGTQDTMAVIAEALRQGLQNAAMAAVWDPAAVSVMAGAGPGAEVTIDLGGKTDMPLIGLKGAPLRVTGRVRTLSDGRWIVRGPMYTGVQVNTGPSAVLEVEGLRIVVVSKHHEPWDLGIFTSLGIEPQHCRYLLLKSRIHYRAGFAPLAKATITCDGEGVTTSDNSQLKFENIRHPIFPHDWNMQP